MRNSIVFIFSFLCAFFAHADSQKFEIINSTEDLKNMVVILNTTNTELDLTINESSLLIQKNSGVNFDCNGLDVLELNSPKLEIPLLVDCNQTVIYREV